jgi:hypothetical protein
MNISNKKSEELENLNIITEEMAKVSGTQYNNHNFLVNKLRRKNNSK